MSTSRMPPLTPDDTRPTHSGRPARKADIARKISALLREVQAALDARQPTLALDLLEQARSLENERPRLVLLRGEAQLMAGHDLGALHSFQTVLQQTQERELVRRARLGAAVVLEKQGEYDAAELMLDAVGRGVQGLRARLHRRRRAEPAVRVCPSAEIVMHDTLKRAPAAPAVYYGHFAVQVSQVARAWRDGQDRDAFLNASYQFVELLAQIRHEAGDPLFALRFICDPDSTPIPEQRLLTIALVARVTGEDEATCRDYALNLWATLAAILPGADKAYYFTPVVDDEALDRLLNPFPVESMAQILRREDAHGDEESVYSVHPFTARTLDLHGLCSVLQQQKSPSLVSIHLLPTALMPWEAAALARWPEDSRPTAGTLPIDEDDPLQARWQTMPRLAQAQVNRSLLEALRNMAYVMTVNTASASRNPLFPGQIATTLFGTPDSASGSLQGGYEVVNASRPEEWMAAHRNLETIDVEHWAPSRMPRLRHLVSQKEAALTFRLPVPGSSGVPGVAPIPARPTPPPPHLPAEGTLLGQSVARVGGMPIRVRQGRSDRRRHTYVVGKTGTGKSTLFANLALQDIEDGQGVCVIDPHGELVNDILLRIPEDRADDVIVFDPADDSRPIGLNLLESRSESEKNMIVNEFIGLLVLMYDPHQQGIVGPRFQHNVRNAMLTVMSQEGSTLIEVVRALTDTQFVGRIIPTLTDPLLKAYWTKQISSTSDFHKSEILDYIVSKFSRFVGDSRIRHIVGQRYTTLDFRAIMDERKVLLVNLSKGKIGPENAQFLGLLLVQRLLLTALSRADMPAAHRPDFMLYVDEFQNFATPLFATVLSEGRKYGVAATMANQYLTQLIPSIREAVFGNVGTILSFNLGVQDALALTPEMYPVFGAEDFVGLPKFTACAKLLLDGSTTAPFTLQTLPNVRQPDEALRARLIARSRERYGCDADELREEITARFNLSFEKL